MASRVGVSGSRTCRSGSPHRRGRRAGLHASRAASAPCCILGMPGPLPFRLGGGGGLPYVSPAVHAEVHPGGGGTPHSIARGVPSPPGLPRPILGAGMRQELLRPQTGPSVRTLFGGAQSSPLAGVAREASSHTLRESTSRRQVAHRSGAGRVQAYVLRQRPGSQGHLSRGEFRARAGVPRGRRNAAGHARLGSDRRGIPCRRQRGAGVYPQGCGRPMRPGLGTAPDYVGVRAAGSPATGTPGQAPVHPPRQGRLGGGVPCARVAARAAARPVPDAPSRRCHCGTGDVAGCVQELAGGRISATGQSDGEVYPAPGALRAVARPPLPPVAGARASLRPVSPATQRGTAASKAAGPCGEETMLATEPDGWGSGRRRALEDGPPVRTGCGKHAAGQAAAGLHAAPHAGNCSGGARVRLRHGARRERRAEFTRAHAARGRAELEQARIRDRR